jgi:hypothetical protein
MTIKLAGNPELDLMAQELVDSGAYDWSEAYEIAEQQINSAVNADDEPVLELDGEMHDDIDVLDDELDA